MTATQASGAPPTPYRTRQVRPTFYRSELTGSLPPDVRDLLLGLTTMADDEGWMLWRPSELAATIYPYQSTGRRLRDLERRATLLVEAGLVVIKECGCAFLPTLQEHHGHRGGEKTKAIWAWHHASNDSHSVGLRSATDDSVSVSGSSSSSSSVSDSGSGSSSSGARGIDDSAVCKDCRRPLSVHRADCPVLRNPSLSVVNG